MFDFNFTSHGNFEKVVDDIYSDVAGGLVPFVFTPNVELIVNLAKDAEMHQFLRRSFVVLPDGMPLIWLSKVLRSASLKKMSGSDLFPVFWERVKSHESKVLFVCATDELAELIRHDYAPANCYVPPFFDVSGGEYEKVLKDISHQIISNEIDFVVAGISYPKREILCRDLYSMKLRKEKYLLIGAAAEFHFGLKRRAPIWMQENGLEWLHRLATEPRRLFKRYFVTGLKFVPIAISEILKRP